MNKPSLRLVGRIGLAALVAVLVGGQAVRIETTNPSVERDLGAPQEIKAALHRACYDCHSNETIWPWYSHVAPVSWLLARDVKQGRGELNFSKWGSYSTKRQAKKLDESREEIADGAMPPWYYAVMHPAASLSARQRDVLLGWLTDERAQLLE